MALGFFRYSDTSFLLLSGGPTFVASANGSSPKLPYNKLSGHLGRRLCAGANETNALAERLIVTMPSLGLDLLGRNVE
jgi:hypothetical protein